MEGRIGMVGGGGAPVKWEGEVKRMGGGGHNELITT